MSKPDADSMAFFPWLMAVQKEAVILDAGDLRRHLYRWGVEAGILPRERWGATNNTQYSRINRAWEDPAKRHALVDEARRYYVAKRERLRAKYGDLIIKH